MRIFLTALMAISMASVSGQRHQEPKFFLLKSDGSSASDLDDATIFVEVVQNDDTTFRVSTYNKNGPLINVQTFRDKDLNVPHGLFAWYDAEGRIDSMGQVFNRKKDGDWIVFNDSLKQQLVSRYDRGKLLSRWDVINHVMLFRDPAQPPAEKEEPHALAMAYYPGGQKGWTRYLEHHLLMPDRGKKLAYDGSGRMIVVVAFNVDKSGVTSDWMMFRSAEWSVDKESMRVIAESGRWEPAMRDGAPTVFRQLQSITYQIR